MCGKFSKELILNKSIYKSNKNLNYKEMKELNAKFNS